MIGGISDPPVEATASMAPATEGRTPVFFISGMMNVPIVITLATGEPEIIPIRALENTAVLAGPPRRFQHDDDGNAAEDQFQQGRNADPEHAIVEGQDEVSIGDHAADSQQEVEPGPLGLARTSFVVLEQQD